MPRKYSGPLIPGTKSVKQKGWKKKYTRYVKAKPKAAFSAKTQDKKIKSNAKEIKKLKYDKYGILQICTSRVNNTFHISKTMPVVFHVSNPDTGTHGPSIYQEWLGSVGDNNRKFTKDTSVFNDNELLNHPNGSEVMMRYALFHIKFSGFLQDCRIRIDIIRQKKLDSDFYNQNEGKQFLPDSMHGLADLAGFTANRINRDTFQVLQTKYLYLNSMGQKNVLDAALGGGPDENTIQGSTSTSTQCKIFVPINKLLKQLRPTVDQLTRVEDPDVSQSDTLVPNGASWSYDNQHPLANIWCLISTDDDNALTDGVTGEMVTVDIIRRVAWQDPVA